MNGQILVFEDRDESFADLEKGFIKEGKPKLLKHYIPKKEGRVKPEDLDRLFVPKAPIGLVVLDQDLSLYKGAYVSSAEVKESCLRMGMPLCVYATKNEDYKVKEYMAWSEAQIALDSRDSMDGLAKKCLIIFQGFSELRSAFDKARGRKKDAPSVLQKVLKAPTAASAQIQQYAWGERQILARVKNRIHSRYMATMAGYWIFNVLLRFPGVMLNEIAAASYLGILPVSFAENSVRRLFARAEYSGPFAGLGQFWWAAELDSLISGLAGNRDSRGLTYARKNGLKVSKARCIEGKHLGAGYYCIITGEPVCLRHSDSPSGWLPLGADRSRISQSKYRQLSPWLGI